ncbi:MAG: helix-turn-helix domain-containing protein [Pseudomonadota bacterium]
MSDRPADGLGTQLRRLLELLDGELEAIYQGDDPDYRPRYTPIMKALADGTPRTIKEIAAQSSISHSAASQTLSKMTRLGWTQQQPGRDARARLISLTARGQALLPKLQRRWAATTRAAMALDDELTIPLSLVLQEAIDALSARSFRDRISAASRG